MAKMIQKSRRRRRSVTKSVRRAGRRVIVKTKEIYRRAKSINVTKKDIILSVAGAGAGAIGSAIVLQKLPIQNTLAKNAVVTAIGGFLAYKGVKKRNMAITGLGMGMAAVGAKGLVGVAVPSLAAPYVTTPLDAPYVRALGAPVVRRAPRLNGCRTVRDEEFI